MTTPTAQELQVAFDALRTEAGVWDQQSSQMGQVASKVQGMQLGRIEAGVFQLIVGPYNEVVQAVTARSNEAVQAMTSIGSTLRDIATVYEQEEAAGIHRLRNLY